MHRRYLCFPNWTPHAAARIHVHIFFIPFPTPAAPLYGPDGELIYAGADRRTGGVLEYYFDVVYVAAFVQLLGAFTDWAWLALLAIPAYALWLLWCTVLSPWWNAPKPGEGPPESAADRKRREKRERQANRAEKFQYRR